jgi:hypothetical protein
MSLLLSLVYSSTKLENAEQVLPGNEGVGVVGGGGQAAEGERWPK